MAYRFSAGLVQDLSDFIISSEIYVRLCGEENTVAHITDVCDPADHRKMRICFEKGTIHFAETYDGPLQEHRVSIFREMYSEDESVSLHRFLFENRACLCSNGSFYPVEADRCGDMFSIKVYAPGPEGTKTLPEQPEFAVIRQTEAFPRGYRYEICMDELPSNTFLMAIFSLPLLV